ncbi:MAG: 2-oxoacid:acceptor oxidoreductase subunit alpha [Candidatus Marinimicrobia bacterium]|jgi:2-oxoglutarate ferredoxin oxidoreductase subunit alpha|nr:2-oxoacid:acceptor oxidoreductase subunit alpha [Candidatus Neomarinimicrobiota bacterium]MBT3633884.1 2-oxoacid:acceptor oxidoreductase subunit alpha [Candidatus Neomarinimicrobiota bacterium]MBT3682866.1 2-oxoacid:acceptor oxidoreductase subunit alpha [Candidatus Neomarinimicrobiota bacterium]MBT3759947.1 2-oxoacid:acceptor oxidoreductase subunit alpha [Candidatus Neomarinimicrobiota bacterium]MBT3896041.1 2-oxoacid:acceptor oxidoreductase subunit alpha [Candidatus Neomarinimicrobiota bact
MTNSKTNVTELTEVTIRFAGDSGDGMQLTGTQFSDNTAIFGNDLATFPDYPSEIRAPAGSLAGVSSFQIQFSKLDIHTPGDDLNVLVAMNPAALKVHLGDVKDNGTVIINEANFTKKNLNLAGYDCNPLETDLLKNFQTVKVDMTKLVGTATEDLKLAPKLIARSANMFALGLVYWLYGRKIDNTVDFIQKKFAKKPEIVEANLRALKAGYNYGNTLELVKTTYHIPKAKFEPGCYRNMMGNQALAYGFMTAAEKSGLELFYGGYPITPASDVLHYLSGYKNMGVKTFQAEDEIAGVVSAIGAAYAGDLAITATSGPGVALKSEAIGLAVMAELPLVIINVQRGGPSTGLPTKTEQSDLYQAVWGRNGEAPCVVISASTPADCFYTAIEAARIALKFMIPVILLSDGYIANGSEPWRIPDVDSLPEFENHKTSDPDGYEPFDHSSEFLARPWATPGTPGLEHRIGGLEKWDGAGHVSYDPENHDHMLRLRQKKVDIIAEEIPDEVPYGEASGNLLIISWGGTMGSVRSAVEHIHLENKKVSHVHLRHLNPFPKNLGDIIKRFDKVLVPELNLGQLATMLRAKYLVPTIQMNINHGKPLKTSDVLNKINEILGE